MAYTPARTQSVAKMAIPEAVDLSRLAPDEDNPRERDDERFEILKESLRIAGHILPLYSMSDQIISGHQRFSAAKELGATSVPVVWIEDSSLLRRAGLNILFNLAINDFADPTSPAASMADIENHLDLIRSAPSVNVASPTAWPCMDPQRFSLDVLNDANPEVGSISETGFESAHALRVTHQICVPIVCRPDGKIINGRRRLAAANYGAEEWWPCIVLDADNATSEAIGALLNHLSMNFDLRRYKTTLKAGVWLNEWRQRQYLGRGYVFRVSGKKKASEFDINLPEDRVKWIDRHGRYVVDFGAGHLTEVSLLQSNGIRAVPFEPYYLPPKTSKPDIDASRLMTVKFLEDVERGDAYTSIFANSVLNQVPFPEDRIYILAILAALAFPNSPTYLSTLSVNDAHWANHAKGKRRTQRVTIETKLGVDYEDGALLGGLLGEHPLVQKYMSKNELSSLLSNFWQEVTVAEHDKILYADALHPKRPNLKLLRKSLWEEFENLPYHDGSTLGCGEVAIRAFEKRLGVVLPEEQSTS